MSEGIDWMVFEVKRDIMEKARLSKNEVFSGNLASMWLSNAPKRAKDTHELGFFRPS